MIADATVTRYGDYASVSKYRVCVICKESTREDKKYCPKHLKYMPYVKSLLERQEARKAELKEEEELTILTQEVVQRLKYKVNTSIDYMSQELRIPYKVVKRIAKEHPSISLGYLRRGTEIMEWRG